MSKTTKIKQILSLNPEELKTFFTHIISNNRHIQKKGKIPVAIEVVGESGIGKTSSIIQLAEELDLSFVKLNLAQIEEIGDLVGFPIRQFEMLKIGEKENVWVDENAADEHTKLGFAFTGKNRMGYCPPEWISNKKAGGILLLDDWNRADVRFIQAVMELIDRQQYISWKLPEDWHIVLTANPDNGEYSVNSIDPAQKTRFISVNLKFDSKCWARWAEKEDIDGRCINFLLLHPDLVNRNVNARSIVMFFNSISSLENFEKDLALIQQIAEGCVGEDFANLFTMFINNKLDKLISPEEMMEGANFQEVERKMFDCIGRKDEYRGDIAGTISTRLINYCIYKTKPESGKDEIDRKFIQRLSSVILTKVFASDISYAIVKQIFYSSQKFKLMTLNPELSRYITN